MPTITPFLWFDTNAEEAMSFYVSLFKNSKIVEIARFTEAGPGRKGSPMTVSVDLDGQRFVGLNGGPEYKHTPAISLFVNCATPGELDRIWPKLAEGGTVLMELAEYPFSPKFGWLSDKYGVSWQLNLGSRKHKVTPFLMFGGQQHGKAEEAINLYLSLFADSRIVEMKRYGKGEGETEGAVMRAIFELQGLEFMAIDGGTAHTFTFTPAFSFAVGCESQSEIDRYWDRFLEGGLMSGCGWLNDKYGVSWQIVPETLGRMIHDPDPEKVKRVIQALFPMKKLDLAALKRAYEGL